MRIGFDARCLQTASAGGGIGRYARGLIERLPVGGDEMIVYISSRRPAPEMTLRPDARVESLKRPARAITLWDPLAWPRRLRADGIDVFHSPFYGVPTRPPAGVGVVATVHDLTPVLFAGAVSARQRTVFRRHFARAVSAHRIVVPSERTRRDLVEHLGADAARIAVAPPGIDPLFRRRPAADIESFRQATTGGRPYVLHAGGLDPIKDVATLVEAFALLAKRRSALDLVVCGTAEGERREALVTKTRRAGLSVVSAGDGRRVERGTGRTAGEGGDAGTGPAAPEQAPSPDADPSRVVLAGRLDDATLAAAYAGAEVFAFPSLYEGFGLPPVEAMACGCPVVCSTGGSLEEVAGAAALTFAPGDAEALAGSLERILADENLRERLVQAGAERAGAFSWDKTIELTRGVYAEALAAARGTVAGASERPAGATR